MEITVTKKLCIALVVNKGYQKYIPMFLYFCLKSYPEYGIKIFLTGKLKNMYADIVVKLCELGAVEIIESCYEEYSKRNSQELKTLRWLIEFNNFEGYDYVYTGDVDIIICREQISLLDQHLDHCEKLKLPYSNSVRPDSKRLSGLHFVKKNEYYAQMDVVIQKYKELLRSGRLVNWKNEEILYRMVVESGLSLPQGWFRPHHGIHLGRWRKGELVIPDKFWKAAKKEDYRKYYEFYKSLRGDLLYKEVYDSVKLPEIDYMERSLKENL